MQNLTATPIIPKNKDDIASIAYRGVSLVQNSTLRDALSDTYRSPNGKRALAAAHDTFDRLISSNWSEDTLCRFLSGWQSMHGTALFVSGLVIRLHRQASETSGEASVAMYRAAGQVGEIIPEDTGVDDVPHNERFEVFANQIVGGDRWKLSRYSIDGCNTFRRYIKQQRLAASIEDAILTTAASENWNTGEYTFLDSVIPAWMVRAFGVTKELAIEKSAYISVHAGETELGHFLHALEAWELYCIGSGTRPEPDHAYRVFDRYLGRLAEAFLDLGQVFDK